MHRKISFLRLMESDAATSDFYPCFASNCYVKTDAPPPMDEIGVQIASLTSLTRALKRNI